MILPASLIVKFKTVRDVHPKPPVKNALADTQKVSIRLAAKENANS